MDLMSILGWIFGTALIILGIVLTKTGGTAEIPEVSYDIVFDNINSFIDPTSILIVVGGTIAALMVAFPVSFFAKIPKHLKIVILPIKYNPIQYIDQIVDFAKEARINGLLALESKLQEVEDDFLKGGLLMVVDAVDADKVKELLEAKMVHLDDRHSQSISFYEKAGNFAPAFGMIGTLIGLVMLLGQLSDPSALGPAMAVALITTFYGTVLSNFVFGPIATKLQVRHDEELLCKMIICEGIQAIQAGDNPKFIREKLLQLLPNKVALMNAEDDGNSEGDTGKGKKAKKPKKEKQK